MTVRQRMLALKTSYEPRTTLGLFAALGYLPKLVQDQLFDLLVSRATAVMTNVPGPSEPLTVAGSVLKQSLFWVPQTGDTGMGVSILSYAGQGPVRPHLRRRADADPGSGRAPLSRRSSRSTSTTCCSSAEAEGGGASRPRSRPPVPSEANRVKPTGGPGRIARL